MVNSHIKDGIRELLTKKTVRTKHPLMSPSSLLLCLLSKRRHPFARSGKNKGIQFHDDMFALEFGDTFA